MKKILLFVCMVIMLFVGMDTEYSAAEVQKSQINSLESFTVLEMPKEQMIESMPEAPVQLLDETPVEGNLQWQKYSSKYFYNQLSEAEQKWWDTLDALGMRYLTSQESLMEKDTYTMSDGYVMEYYITPPVAYDGITPERAREVLYMFRYSNPQYYFFQTMVYSSGNESGIGGMYRLTLYPAFADGVARAEITAQFKEKIGEWVAIVDAPSTDLEKEKAAYDLLCKNTTYDQNQSDITLRNEYNQSIYSVFFTESTVCAGYAQTMQLLMNAVGIDCAAVTSTGHEWNIIRLNGTWYNLDATWGDLDDNAGCELRYTYFNRSEKEFLGSDSNTITGHTALDYWKTYLPETIHDSGADFYSIGTIHMPENRMQAPVITVSGGMATISAEAGAKIYYTVDGNIPAVAGAKADCYRAPFPVKNGQKIQAIAVKNACWDSEIAVCEVELITYTVQFYTYSGSKVESQEVIEGGTVQKPSMPIWGGHQFCGWYTDASYQHPYDFNTAVTSDFVLYAKWIRGVYTVRFYSNGGSDVASQPVEERKKASKPADPVRKGYIFAGWYTDAALTRRYNFSTPVLADVNLYAKWDGRSYSLKLNATGGYIGKTYIVSQIKTVVNGEKYGVLPVAKRKGYNFLGWFTRKNGGEQVTRRDKVFLTGNDTLYAKWEKITMPKASVLALKSKKPGVMRVKIKKNTKALGYQIRYSLKENMKSAEKVKVQNAVNEITGLKKGKTYFVQVRMYQKDSAGKPVYGAWSKKKTVMIEK